MIWFTTVVVLVAAVDSAITLELQRFMKAYTWIKVLSHLDSIVASMFFLWKRVAHQFLNFRFLVFSLTHLDLRPILKRKGF